MEEGTMQPQSCQMELQLFLTAHLSQIGVSRNFVQYVAANTSSSLRPSHRELKKRTRDRIAFL